MLSLEGELVRPRGGKGMVWPENSRQREQHVLSL